MYALFISVEQITKYSNLKQKNLLSHSFCRSGKCGHSLSGFLQLRVFHKAAVKVSISAVASSHSSPGGRGGEIHFQAHSCGCRQADFNSLPSGSLHKANSQYAAGILSERASERIRKKGRVGG